MAAPAEIAPFRLYISVGRDLGEERELLGTTLTEIPVDLGWRINYSPTGNEPLEPEVIGSSDLHLVLLGADISAPVGQEYFFARRSGRHLILLMKMGVNRTPAATDFARFLESHGHWQPFNDKQSLRSIYLKALTSRLVEMASDLRLSEVELEKLLSWRGEIIDISGKGEAAIRGGAGESSVILSVERFYPSEGVVLKDANDEE